MSTRPGSTVRPDRSTRSAPAGTGTTSAAPTALMRSPSMTMRGVFDGRPAGAVYKPRVLEHQNTARRLGGNDC